MSALPSESADQLRERLRAALDGTTPWQPTAPSNRASLLTAMDSLRPQAIAHLARLGIPRDITEASLADIGRKQAIYDCLVADDWLVHVFTGGVLTFGRLQYERLVSPSGRRDIHIPELGPLKPALVDDSLGLARQFFGPGTYQCSTWLFDPHLDELPETSNIRSFAGRFTIGPAIASRDSARNAAKFVFRTRLTDLAPEPDPADSSLQRLVRNVLATEGTWSEPTGVMKPA